MISKKPKLIIPAQRYFSLMEVCEIVGIRPQQFAEWQRAHGVVVGYGGDRYTRQDVIKLLHLQGTFAPFEDEFNHHALDSDGQPAIDANAVKSELKQLLATIEKTLAE